MIKQMFSVIRVTDDGEPHYAAWNAGFMGAVAGRFESKADAEDLCDRLNGGETPNYNPRPVVRAKQRNHEYAALLSKLADGLAARLGTNADEWADVRAARKLLGE